MEWIIFLLLSFAVTIINEHVGFVGIHYLITLFIFAGAYVDISGLGKILKVAEKKRVEKEIKRYNGKLKAWGVAAVCSYIMGTILNVAAFLMTSGITGEGNITSLSPVRLFEDEGINMSIVLLIISEALGFVATFLLLRRKNLLHEMVDDETAPGTPLFRLVYKLDILTAFSVFAATLVGCFNNYFGALSLIVHMFYLILLAMMIILISNYNKTYKTEKGRKHKVEFFTGMQRGGRYNQTYILMVWIITVASIALQLFMAYSFRYEGLAMFNYASNQTVTLCAIVMDLVMSWLLTSTISNIKANEH